MSNNRKNLFSSESKILKLPTRKFQRRIENFTCYNCGAEVIGNGFTNHCHKCMYSKHVDINPGDRAEECKGLMKPIGLFKKNGQSVVEFQCLNCGITKTNKISENDNLEVFNYTRK